MYKTINVNEFRAEFDIKGRGDSFSYEGLGALYEVLMELGSNKLDVIGLCCEFSEDEPESFLEAYEVESVEELRDNTLVIDIPGRSSIIIQDY